VYASADITNVAAVKGSLIVLTIGWFVDEIASPGGISPTPETPTYHWRIERALAVCPVYTSYSATSIDILGHDGSAAPASLPAGL